MKPRSLFVAAFLLCVLVLSSCVVSVHPLADPETCKEDPGLTGIWARDDIRQFWVIGRHWKAEKDGFPRGLMRMSSLGFGNDNRLHEEGFNFFVTTVGNDSFVMEISDDAVKQEVWNKDKITGYTIRRYRVSDKRLEFFEADGEVATTLIESNEIRGTASRAKDGTPAIGQHFTDTTANLVRFLKQGGAHRLFPEKTKRTFTRLR